MAKMSPENGTLGDILNRSNLARLQRTLRTIAQFTQVLCLKPRAKQQERDSADEEKRHVLGCLAFRAAGEVDSRPDVSLYKRE